MSEKKEEIGFRLNRPMPTEESSYQVLTCWCGNDTNFEIALSDNGQWTIECLSCLDAAVLISDLINALK